MARAHRERAAETEAGSPAPPWRPALLAGLIATLAFIVVDLLLTWGSEATGWFPPAVFLTGFCVGLTRARPLVWLAGAAVAVAVALIIGTQIMPRLAAPLVREDPLRPADAVVCLSSGATTEGRLDNFGTERLLGALRLMRDGVAPVLVRTRLPEGYAPVDGDVRELADLAGVTAEIWAVGPVGNTRDEAALVAELARERGWRRIVLVTNATHSRRAAATFEAVGLEVISRPCPSRTYSTLGPCSALDNVFLTQSWVHEQLGWVAYRHRGWVR